MKRIIRRMFSLALAVLIAAASLPMSAEALTYCTMSFDSNGGSGTMGNVQTRSGDFFKLPECGFTPPAGKEFVCWTAPGYSYRNAGSSAYVSEDIVWTARWRSTTVTHRLRINGVYQYVKEGDLVNFSKPADGTVPDNKYFIDFKIIPEMPAEMADYRYYYEDWFLMPASDLWIDYVYGDQESFEVDFTHVWSAGTLPEAFWASFDKAVNQELISKTGGSTTKYDLDGDGDYDLTRNYYNGTIGPIEGTPDTITVSGIKNAPYHTIKFVFKDNTPHSITVIGGKAYIDTAEFVPPGTEIGSDPVTAAPGGTNIVILPDMPEDKRVIGWTTDVEGIGPFTRSAASFGMPTRDITVTAVYSTPLILDLGSGETVSTDADVMAWELRSYLGSSYTSHTAYYIDLDGDGSDDIKTVWYPAESGQDSRAEITAVGSSNLGIYHLYVDSPHKYWPVTFILKDSVRGDVDLDYDVDAADLTALARHVASIESLSSLKAMGNADVTGDEFITAADLTKLARYVAHIIDEL